MTPYFNVKINHIIYSHIINIYIKQTNYYIRLLHFPLTTHDANPFQCAAVTLA